MSSIVFLNGRFVEADEATVSVWDGGWLHGAGLFETMRAHRGRIFRLSAHLERIAASAAGLLFPLDRPDLPLTSDLLELLERNRLKEARVRLTVSAGSMRDPPEPDRRANPQPDARPRLTVCATAAPMDVYPEEMFRRGIGVCVCPYRQSAQDPLAGHKSTCYLPRLLGLRAAHQQGCSESLWLTAGNLMAEGCITNLFIVRGDMVLTPPLNTPVLPGITRGVTLEIARQEGISCQETSLTLDDVLRADEVFVTNSIMTLMPVCRVERQEIGSGKPGAMTARLRDAYLARLEKECSVDG